MTPSLNFTALAIAAFIPLIVGYIWYHPKVFGNAISAQIHGEPTEKKHSPLVYIVTLFLSLLMAMLIGAILSTHDPADVNLTHGAFHGAMASIFMAIPAFAIIALFEAKSMKYILIHAFYWLISMAIMGMIIGAMS
ncbi:MAG: DUF1761 domain-containing protein [Saprospiraceae bacterium]|nr:DUF1761 domain-containing protein [Saprospiraceae bacterium]